MYAAAEAKVPKEPVGLFGDGAIVFGGGAVFDKQNKVSFNSPAASLAPTMRAGDYACTRLPSSQTDNQDAPPLIHLLRHRA